jgi:tetratricopeptide (TPR) repeat protein
VSTLRCVLIGLFAFIFCLAGGSLRANAKESAARAELSLTTKSPEARRLFLQGRSYRENWRLPEALQAWRAAAQKDQNFALAQLYVSMYTPDPKEEASARAAAWRLAPQASHGEQLMVQWFASAKEGNFVAAIAAINDVVELYPKDKWILFQSGRWMILQRNWEKGQALLERALALDPDYIAALNQLGYLYASYGPQFEKSFKAFEHYSRVRPHEPNPQDSWAEVLRMAGEYGKALDHYRKALGLDPKFVSSQLGIADTYALMGDEARARLEYEKAIQMAPNQREKITYMVQLALTYVREGNLDTAGQHYSKIAQSAHEFGMFDVEADCHRYMAMYDPDFERAMGHLDAAEKVIREDHSVAAEDLDLALSRVLLIRAWRASRAGKTNIIAGVVSDLHKLSSRNASNLIRQNYHSAAGMLALAQGKYSDAVSHLEEEDRFTHLIAMEQLALAYEKTGNREEANKLRADLKRSHLTGIEQVVVADPMRDKAASAQR